jgi:hypothetical protein
MLAVAGVTAMAVNFFPAPTLMPPHPRLNKDTESRSVKRAKLDRTALAAFIIKIPAPRKFFRVNG